MDNYYVYVYIAPETSKNSIMERARGPGRMFTVETIATRRKPGGSRR